MAKQNKANIIYWIVGIVILVLALSQLPLDPLFTIIAPEEEVFEEPGEKIYEYYDEGDKGEIGFYYGAKVGNVFEVGAVGPNENFNITSLEVQLKRQGYPGTIYVEILKSGTKEIPYGEVLSSGSINGNYLDETNFELKEIEMTPYTLNAGEKYVFLLYATGGDVLNSAQTRIYNRNLYSGGSAVTFSEAGWDSPDYFTVLFKINGIGPV